MLNQAKIKHDKMQDFQTPANCIFEEKVYLWNNNIIISGHDFMEGLSCFYKKVLSSVTIFIFTAQICYWLPCTLFRKTSLKMHSLETTLTTLIHIKNSFITDYAENDDIQDNMKNSFITEFADYLVFNTTDLKVYIH